MRCDETGNVRKKNREVHMKRRETQKALKKNREKCTNRAGVTLHPRGGLRNAWTVTPR